MEDYNDIVNCLADYGAEIKPCQSGEGGIYVKGEKVDVGELLENFFCVKETFNGNDIGNNKKEDVK